MKIAIGSDHAGFKLKKHIIGYLKRNQISFKDFGTFSEESCDYSDYAFPVARAVAKKKYSRGILICGSGVGMTIVANKVRGIRAVNAYDIYSAEQSRLHGDCNILCLGARRLSKTKAIKIVDVWLKTEFLGEERHLRRIKKIDRS